jgi:DNA invertase Pin-like site-specific DNA recombinase
MRKPQKQLLAIYIRVSDRKQVKHGMSLHDQRERGIKWAKHIGWEYEIFEDAGLSGGLTKDRPKLAELVERIAADEIQGLYTVELDRLTREITDGNFLISLLIDKKIRFFDYTGEKDIQDEGVEAITRIGLVFNNLVKRGISRKVKRNLETRILDGKAPAGRLQAYGFDKDANGYLIIHEEEAKVVRIMFDLANSDNSVVKIAAYLNKLNYKTKVGKNFTGSYVYKLLTKSMYKGVLLHGDNGKKPGHTYSRKEYPCPAIVNPVLYDNVQSQLQTRNTFKETNNTEFFLLKGLLRCRVCGKKYYVHKPRTGQKLLNTYQCKSGQTAAGCGNKGLYVSSLDKIIIDNTLNLVEIVKEAFSDADLAYRSSEMSRNAEIAQLRIKDLQTEKKRLVDSIVKGWITADDVDITKRMADYNNGISAATQLYDDCLKELQIVNHKDEILELCQLGVQRLKKMKEQKDKVDFLRSVIDKIEITYNKDDKAFDIWINFKLNQLERYLIIKEVNFKTPLLRNSSYKNPTILSERISLQYLINVDEETESVIVTQPTVNFDGFREKHLPKSPLKVQTPGNNR